MEKEVEVELNGKILHKIHSHKETKNLSNVIVSLERLHERVSKVRFVGIGEAAGLPLSVKIEDLIVELTKTLLYKEKVLGIIVKEKTDL